MYTQIENYDLLLSWRFYPNTEIFQWISPHKIRPFPRSMWDKHHAKGKNKLKNNLQYEQTIANCKLRYQAVRGKLCHAVRLCIWNWSHDGLTGAWNCWYDVHLTWQLRCRLLCLLPILEYQWCNSTSSSSCLIMYSLWGSKLKYEGITKGAWYYCIYIFYSCGFLLSLWDKW